MQKRKCSVAEMLKVNWRINCIRHELHRPTHDWINTAGTGRLYGLKYVVNNIKTQRAITVLRRKWSSGHTAVAQGGVTGSEGPRSTFAFSLAPFNYRFFIISLRYKSNVSIKSLRKYVCTRAYVSTNPYRSTVNYVIIIMPFYNKFISYVSLRQCYTVVVNVLVDRDWRDKRFRGEKVLLFFVQTRSDV